jgi:hypothetical protein
VSTVEWWKGGGTWVSVPDLSVPRYSLAAAEFAGRLVAIGGSDGYNSLTVVESWAEGESAWRGEVPIPLGGRQRHSVAVWGVGMEQVGSENRQFPTNQWRLRFFLVALAHGRQKISTRYLTPQKINT